MCQACESNVHFARELIENAALYFSLKRCSAFVPVKFLGVILAHALTWESHVDFVSKMSNSLAHCSGHGILFLIPFFNVILDTALGLLVSHQ